MIDYKQILDKNLSNVLKDILGIISKNGIGNNALYITFYTNDKKVDVPNWLKDKYPEEMTIVIQHEYDKLKVYDDYFTINLSFSDIYSDLKIPFNSIVSFADPSANFGLKIKNKLSKKNYINEKNLSKKNTNVINFKEFKKN